MIDTSNEMVVKLVVPSAAEIRALVASGGKERSNAPTYIPDLTIPASRSLEVGVNSADARLDLGAPVSRRVGPDASSPSRADSEAGCPPLSVPGALP